MFDIHQVAAQATQAYASGDWRSIPIRECGEPLVRVEERIARSWYPEHMGLVSSEGIFLRVGTYEALRHAANLLNAKGFDLVVLDGWRSPEVQAKLFWTYLKQFTAPALGAADAFLHATSTDEIERAWETLEPVLRDRLKEANRTYVSWPSTEVSAPYPHGTGGSVDVWIEKDGSRADLGVEFDEMREAAGAFYHLRSERVHFEDDACVCSNRELLLRAMYEAGFSSLPSEIWHFNFGNQMDALVKGGTARYGFAAPK